MKSQPVYSNQQRKLGLLSKTNALPAELSKQHSRSRSSFHVKYPGTLLSMYMQCNMNKDSSTGCFVVKDRTRF